MTSGGKEAVPFVKYELLATMRAIGEKVAAQYVARTGTASYSGLYELIRDVPRGPDDQAATKATDLVTAYQGDYATGGERSYVSCLTVLLGYPIRQAKSCWPNLRRLH